jgi:hypothetical protein
MTNPRPPRASDASAELTVVDALTLGLLLALGVVATASLALAHADAHSLGLVVLVSVPACTALVAALFRIGGRPPIAGDRAGLGVVLAAGVLAAVMFFPGFSYGVAEKDPGVYVAHAQEIARYGTVDFIDEAYAAKDLPVQGVTPGIRFAAMFVRDKDSGRIVPQFYHLWPALLATGHDAAGIDAIWAATPAIGVLAVMLFVALLLRIGGVAAAAIGGLLLCTNMLQVWQAKYPTAEILAQAFFLGTLLAMVVAAQTRWRPALFLAGLFVGIAFLNRADGWVFVMLACAALAALYISGRDDRAVAWGAAGLAVLLPYALWQAYSFTGAYTTTNHVPGLGGTLGLIALIAMAAVAGRFLLRRPVGQLIEGLMRRRVQFVLGFALCALFAGLMLLGFLRPYLFGNGFYVDPGGSVQRSYDERILRRLSWFLTLPGFMLAGLGLAVVALRRWRLSIWVAVLPALVLLPVFAYKSYVAARLMWWTRRYVPVVVPSMIMLIALALAAAIAWRFRDRRPLRVPAVLAALALAAVFLSQSLPVRGHDEWAGSYEVSQRISRLSGQRDGVYLWQPPLSCCAAPAQLWATPVWIAHGNLSVLLPDRSEEQVDYVRAYRRTFPRRPLFVVWEGPNDPPGLGQLELVKADHLKGTMPIWEENSEERPRRTRQVPYEVRIFRVPGA